MDPFAVKEDDVILGDVLMDSVGDFAQVYSISKTGRVQVLTFEESEPTRWRWLSPPVRLVARGNRLYQPLDPDDVQDAIDSIKRSHDAQREAGTDGEPVVVPPA